MVWKTYLMGIRLILGILPEFRRVNEATIIDWEKLLLFYHFLGTVTKNLKSFHQKPIFFHKIWTEIWWFWLLFKILVILILKTKTFGKFRINFHLRGIKIEITSNVIPNLAQESFNPLFLQSISTILISGAG